MPDELDQRYSLGIGDLPYSEPEDFLEFWKNAWLEAKAVPLQYRRTLQSAIELPTHRIELIDFESVKGFPRDGATGTGETVHGWIAIPKEIRKAPGFLWIPPYGRESTLPNSYSTREGYISMGINLHGLHAFHQESYVPNRGYFNDGIDQPETFIFRRMVQDCFVAARVLQAQLEVEEQEIGCMGLSQGGGLSVALGAHCPIIKAICADLPFWGLVGVSLHERVYRYPLKELTDAIAEIPMGREIALFTLSYFDTAFHARHCEVPAHVTLGLKDPACRPYSVAAIYDALAGKKEIVELDWGHDWHPSMIQMNSSWLQQNLRVQP